MRHTFAIKDLGQSGWFKPHRYRYFCVLCHWTFLVENRRGNAVALDDSGQAVSGAENEARLATFALGPCPAAAHHLQIAEPRENRRRAGEIKFDERRPKRAVLLYLQNFLAGGRAEIVRRSLQDSASDR